MLMSAEIINGKRRVYITRESSGEEKVKEAMNVVMGQGWELKEGINEDINQKE